MRPERRAELLSRLDIPAPGSITSGGASPFAGAPDRIPLRIGGARLFFSTSSPSLARRVKEYFQEYIAPLDAADTCTDVLPEVHAEPLHGPDLWEEEDPEFEVLENKVIQRDFVARSLGESQAIAWVAPELDDAIHNLFRWFLPPVLLKQDALLLHSAAVIRDGEGFVFFGPSGAGKSTSSGLISQADPEAIVIGDDAAILRIENGQAFVTSAPLGCGYSRKAPPSMSAPLRGLFTLRQDSLHRIAEIPLPEALTQLLSQIMGAGIGQPDQAELQMELALRFCTLSPRVKRLHFRKEPGFWPMILTQRSETQWT